MPRMTKVLPGLVALVLGAAVPAAAQTVRLTATLSGANETPALLTGAAGTAEVFVNLATQVVTYRIDVFNIPTVTTAGHFHVGGPGVAGPVVVDLAPPGASDDFALRGSASSTNLRPQNNQGIRTWEDFIQALVGGQVYVNIHSSANPGGEIRGQLIADRQP